MRTLAFVIAAAVPIMPALAADTYDANTNQLTIPYVHVGTTVYTNVVIGLGTRTQVLSIGSHSALPGDDVYDEATNRLRIPGVQVGSISYGNVVLQLGSDFTVLTVGGVASSSRTSTPPGALRIAGVRAVGQPILVFDHLIDKREPDHLPDIQLTAWKEANGTVNVTVPHFENYRMRGPDLEHLTSDPNKIFSSTSSASDIVESHYNYHHWLAAPYTFDGQTIYALAHTEWYACLLNGDCSTRISPSSVSTGSYQPNSWANTVTSFKSLDGGASWTANGLNDAHVVSNESFTWTGSSALAAAVYRDALNHSGLMQPSRIIKEGNYYYSIGFLNHRDFTRLDPTTSQAPIDKYDFVLMRTTDVTRPSGWEGWVSGSQYTPMAGHGFSVFSPRINGRNLNAGPPQIIYDTNAQVYIAMFILFGGPGPIYYMTAPTLANPSWSDAIPIGGTATTQVDPRSASPTAPCNTGFQDTNYVSFMDTHSSGLNFEFTDGDPWLFYVVNPAVCGGDNLARDVYRLQLVIDYTY